MAWLPKNLSDSDDGEELEEDWWWLEAMSEL